MLDKGAYVWRPTFMTDKTVGPPPSPLQHQVGGNHYKEMKFQPVEFIMENDLGFCEGSAIKYICRYRSKGGVQDLEKAKHYIEMLIQRERESQNV
jgi:hypothetical protein